MCLLDSETSLCRTDKLPVAMNDVIMEDTPSKEEKIYVNCVFVCKTVPKGSYLYCFFLETTPNTDAFTYQCGSWELGNGVKRVPEKYILVALKEVLSIGQSLGHVDQKRIDTHIRDKLEIAYLQQEIQKLRDSL